MFQANWRIAFIIQVRHCVSLKSRIQNYISQFIRLNNYDECTSTIMCLCTGLTTYSMRLINLINQNYSDVWQLWLWLHPSIKAVNLDCLDIAALWCQRAAKLNFNRRRQEPPPYKHIRIEFKRHYSNCGSKQSYRSRACVCVSRTKICVCFVFCVLDLHGVNWFWFRLAIIHSYFFWFDSLFLLSR